jgi:hypothetical protein
MPAMTTTVGKLEPPFGKTRLHVMKMFSAILQMNSDEVNEELAKLGTLQAMWVSYNWTETRWYHSEFDLHALMYKQQ